MCTFAWNVTGDKLWVCFNRDENRRRSPAEPPEIHATGQYPVVYATDPEGGGTWLAASAAGYMVALMNNYSCTDGPGTGLVSRGRLVRSLAQRESLGSARELLAGLLESDRYAPFFLFLLDCCQQQMWCWDGETLTTSLPCPQFWTTSSYRTDEVREWRIRRWNEQVNGRDVSLEDAVAILSRREGDPAFCMTMDRQDARTVSQSAVQLDEHGVEYRYFERQRNGSGYCTPVFCRW